MAQPIDMTFAPKPRVNGAQLATMAGKEVIFVGSVSSQGDGRVAMQSSDDKVVNVALSGAAAPATKFAEIQGTVQPDGSIVAARVTNFGDSFDLATYDSLCKYSNQEPLAALFR